MEFLQADNLFIVFFFHYYQTISMVYLSVCLSICLSVCVNLSVCLLGNLSLHLFTVCLCLSCLFVSPLDHSFVYLYVSCLLLSDRNSLKCMLKFVNITVYVYIYICNFVHVILYPFSLLSLSLSLSVCLSVSLSFIPPSR